MDAFLGKITQHAMNYAIRSGVGITASFAISQTSRLLKTVDNNGDYQEIQSLQERLDSKIKIISPAIDMIELISARGNTTLESAVTLTKALRWDIQSLGIRLEKAASAEEKSRKNNNRAKSRGSHEVELRQIILDIRKLLNRIEDAVPLINLAITTSGARLSTTLPTSVSPSRLLQASTFLTAGDTQYSMSSGNPVQVGPAFTLSLYMLFSGHARGLYEGSEGMRDTTWKEVIHKARVRLLRIPISTKGDGPVLKSVENDGDEAPVISGEGKANEFAYHIEVIEDLNDDRVHSFEDGEPQPGPYGDIPLAGIREYLPIHQISKIFYADTGKILNIGNQGETNSPVLLLKRDVNALPPRRMMQDNENTERFIYEDPEELLQNEEAQEEEEDSQDDVDQQLRRESSVHLVGEDTPDSPIQPPSKDSAWRFPQDLDPEWLALEVYIEAEDSESEDELDQNEDSSYESKLPSPSGERASDASLLEDLSNLNLQQEKSPSLTPREVSESPRFSKSLFTQASPFGPIRSSLSLLEMLIRLTALQQFQQASHLSIPDELLTFFLEESSTTGAGGDGDERRRTRREARQKVGFDPYDESPIKRRGEDYQYQNQGQDYEGYSRGGTPYEEYGSGDGYPINSPGWQSPRRDSPQASSENWLRNRDSPSSRRSFSHIPPSSPLSPYKPVAKKGRPLDRVQHERRVVGSPLGRGVSVDTDSSLGTSPGSPTLIDRSEKGGRT